MEDPNITDSHPVANEIQVNFHMLHPLMLNRVGGEVHGADVVAADERAPGKQVVKLSQELPKPRRLSHAISNNPVLLLNTRAGDDRLSLGRPGNQVAVEDESIALGRAAGVWTTSPVSINVYNQLSRGEAVKNQTEVNRATNVAKEAQQDGTPGNHACGGRFAKQRR
jgi:hypothetical protein